jgi:hypothetical protein
MKASGATKKYLYTSSRISEGSEGIREGALLSIDRNTIFGMGGEVMMCSDTASLLDKHTYIIISSKIS